MGWLTDLFGGSDDLAERMREMARKGLEDGAKIGRNYEEEDETDKTAIRQVAALRGGAKVK